MAINAKVCIKVSCCDRNFEITKKLRLGDSFKYKYDNMFFGIYMQRMISEQIKVRHIIKTALPKGFTVNCTGVLQNYYLACNYPNGTTLKYVIENRDNFSDSYSVAFNKVKRVLEAYVKPIKED